MHARSGSRRPSSARRTPIGAGLLLLIVVVGPALACSKKSNDAAPAATPAPTSPSSSAPVAGPGGSSGATVQPAGSVPPISATPGNEAFCLQVAQAFSLLNLPGRGAGTLDQQFQAIKDAFRGVAAAAPPDTAADWKTLSDALQKAQGMAGLSVLGTPEVSAASANVSAWTNTNCGFNPDA